MSDGSDGLSPVCVLVRPWAASDRFAFVQVRSGARGTGRLIAGVVVLFDNPERGRVLVRRLVGWARAYYCVHLHDSVLPWLNDNGA
jgi:hypothetical protein